MVAASVILLGLAFGTFWYLLCYAIFNYLEMPLFSKKQGFTTKKLTSWLLNVDSIITSIFLGMLTVITLFQFVIIGHTDASFIIDRANNSSLVFASYSFNISSLIALINLITVGFILYLAKVVRNRKQKEFVKDSVEISVFDEEKDKDKNKTESIKKESKKNNSDAKLNGSPNLLLGHDKKIDKDAVFSAFTSPRKLDEPKTRAEFKQQQKDENQNK